MNDQSQAVDEPFGVSIVLAGAVLAALLSIGAVPMAQAPNEPAPRPHAAQMEMPR